MKLKSHTKFEEKLSWGLENDMKNLAILNQNTWKCQSWYFHEILLSKEENAWATIYRGVISHDTEERWKIWIRIYLLFQNWNK